LPTASGTLFQWTEPIAASLKPACVQKGGKIALKVHMETSEKASVGYAAYYADGQSGAQAPYGKGYGGNESATTDENGNKTFTWVVSPTAPTGPAHVEIYGTADGNWGHKTLPFKVAEVGGC
jgi:hypothetical protein